ncbi:hypothetical protein AMECASPLE_028112 [Ameca splendens]|uniref:Secreted protein n=1 Tax=Ameca splendens TaxID=208324 RepID=A0ABV1A1R2_9TELE
MFFFLALPKLTRHVLCASQPSCWCSGQSHIPSADLSMTDLSQKSIQGYPLQLHSRRLKSPSAPFTTRTPQLCLHTPEQRCITLNIEAFLVPVRDFHTEIWHQPMLCTETHSFVLRTRQQECCAEQNTCGEQPPPQHRGLCSGKLKLVKLCGNRAPSQAPHGSLNHGVLSYFSPPLPHYTRFSFVLYSDVDEQSKVPFVFSD